MFLLVLGLSAHPLFRPSSQVDDSSCGPGSTNSMGCVGGYFRASADGTVRPCPDGFFCPVNQVRLLPFGGWGEGGGEVSTVARRSAGLPSSTCTIEGIGSTAYQS